MNTHIVGFKPPDAKWKKMKAVWDACLEADTPTPPEVDDFFEHEYPDALGVSVKEEKLRKNGAVKSFNAEMQDGYEIFIDKLPKDVKVIRVYNSY